MRNRLQNLLVFDARPGILHRVQLLEEKQLHLLMRIAHPEGKHHHTFAHVLVHPLFRHDVHLGSTLQQHHSRLHVVALDSCIQGSAPLLCVEINVRNHTDQPSGLYGIVLLDGSRQLRVSNAHVVLSANGARPPVFYGIKTRYLQ